MKAGHAESADYARVVMAERQAVAEEDPLQAHYAEHDEALHEYREDVLPPDETSIEEGESGGHEHNERRAHDHPGCIAGVDHGIRIWSTE